MKIQYFFILLFGIQVASAQINQKNAGQLVDRLHHALMSRDHDELNTLLDSRLSYGHSNLWIESKQELLSNNASGKLIYHHIDRDSLQVTGNGRTMIVRYQSHLNVALNDKELMLQLHVMQVWIRHRGHWRLLARQAVKIS
ncbi:MAG: nuclear transport factor 2 family protein [Saprospiraceae bacterium]